MSFTGTLHQTIAPLTETVEHNAEVHAWEEAVVAQCSPHLLRRFAEIAAAFEAPGLHAAQGAILACRRGPEGYRMVEYDAPDFMITLRIIHGEARLTWRAGDVTEDRRVTLETPDAAIDAILLDAVAAYVTWRTAQTPA